MTSRRVLLLAAITATHATNLRVFLIAGQSNAEGQAEVATINKTSNNYYNGTLAYQRDDPRTAALFAPLWDLPGDNWKSLSDVKVWFNEVGLAPNEQGVNGSIIPSKKGVDASFGDLTVGFGVGAQPNVIGPELGFGFGMHDALNGERILIMKTAWGGKSLAGDFRPPSSVAAAAAGKDPYCQGACPNVVGHFYQVLVDDMHKMLAPGAIATMFPDLAGLTPVFSGLGWFQGSCALPTALPRLLAPYLNLRYRVTSTRLNRLERRMRFERDGCVRNEFR